MAGPTGPSEVSFPTEAMNAALDRLRTAERDVRRRALRLGAIAIVSEAQVESPVRTGALKASHTHDDSNPDEVKIGATARYAAAVHERHPSNPRWFLRVLIERGARIMEKALALAMREAAERGSGGSGGGRS